MKIKYTLEFDEYELARILTLIDVGRKHLQNQDRRQEGIRGYTLSDLDNFEDEIRKLSTEIERVYEYEQLSVSKG